ncbi:uncharacterized protein LOC127799006 isoform X2 [Diospyros lotus]|uniref:uncharacterized protein LOC127799006 isoform X2 n=1 Tax=Diospyros lotus TaxID=55363 RepID=UPI0022542FB2|nr:uncharacterized protein LOC127799006 isoform X2 [Diospyros lotus]
MASLVPKPASARQLGDLLKEQQEPFVLEVYLLERGYLRNKLNVGRSFSCSIGNSSSCLKKSVNWGLNDRRKVIPRCSEIVRAVFKKVVAISTSQRMKNSGNNVDYTVREIAGIKQEKAESDGNRLAITDTCPAFKLANLLQEKEVLTNTNLQWSFGEDTKQHSPMLVLEGVHLSQDSSIHAIRQENIIKKDSLVAVSLCKFTVKSSTKRASCIPRFDPCSQQLIAEKTMKQSKQLLFDCVKELVGSRVLDRGNRHTVKFPGPEELGHLLSGDMRRWCELSANESNTAQLLNLDSMASEAQFHEFKTSMKETVAEIGDAILEDIISKEIAADMIEIVSTLDT